MACIDRFYVRSYDDYEDLLKWCLIYYPKLIYYFYHLDYNREYFKSRRQDFIERFRRDAYNDHARLGNYNNKEEAIENLRKYYVQTANYIASEEQLIEEAENAINNINLNTLEIEDLFSISIATFPMKIDKLLKWRCPLPCVRRYLHEQCGVNPKKEWLYKLTWKGKDLSW